MSAKKPRTGVWRDAVRDSELDSVAKCVAHTLSTWLNGHGTAYPSRETIAKGASLSVRSVERAIVRLEAAGFLEVERSRGRSSHRYAIAMSSTASELRRSEWLTANESRRSHSANSEPLSSNADSHASNGVRRSPKSAESAESGAALPLKGAPLVEDYCPLCGERFVGDGRSLTCEECAPRMVQI
jgi:hypothetical protein